MPCRTTRRRRKGGFTSVAAQLTLEPESRAAGIARRWVRQELTDRSRPELLDSAILGVSELVTNAVLHVRGRIFVRIVDADSKLRIEVYDDSPRPPEGYRSMLTSRPTNPATIGRGLQIVDSISLSWGVAYEDAGKCVWFQPMPETGPMRTGNGPVMPEARGTQSDQQTHGDHVGVDLIDVPVLLLVHYRTRFRDLRREMTLIALDAMESSNVAGQLTAAALALEVYRDTGTMAGKQVEEAIEAGLDRVRLHYETPRAAVPGIVALQRLLREADEFCRSRQLLTLASGPQERALQDWYLGEFVAQAGGAAPTPWPGEFIVTDPEPLP
jgi:anti-sigma regulatory factor (Ser/Thr protein kinase)